ncbi:MAG: 4Fe-4S dicluster domain-containing protein [Candidatus Methanomethyliaceae archaeon]|nr:4Fe-4S dicluster domain-containing protein [Candidatus Methanomethyliaceae archaeon]
MAKLSWHEILDLVQDLRKRGFEVVGPSSEGGVVKLVPLEDATKLEINYVRTLNSPKDFLLPNKERLFRYKSTATITSYGLKIRFPTVEGPCPITIVPEYSPPRGRLAFFGIHPCMVNSIRYLDKVMLSDPVDPYYRARREGLFIAVLECEEGDEYCFCKSVDGDKVPKGYADLSIRKDGDSFIVSARSPIGGNLLTEEGVEEIEEFSPKMKEEYILDTANEKSIESKDPADLLESCTLCSSCTVVCPTCYCSDIQDRFSLMDPGNVERVRIRMSCQRRGYSSIAGGVTFLKTKNERFKWRMKHKFPFSEKMYNMLGCVGCGNCIAFCPSRIDFRGFVGRRVA